MLRFFVDNLIYNFLLLVTFFIYFIGFENLIVVATIMAHFILFVLPRKKKDLVLRNLALSFPESKLRDLNKVFFLSVREMFLSALELIYWYRLSSRSFARFEELFFAHVNWESYDRFEKIFGTRPVLLLTAHFSNFVVPLIYLRLKGKEVGVFLKKARNYKLQGFINKVIDSIGIVSLYIDEKDSLKKALYMLKNNGVVVVLLDQHFGRLGRVKVNFFGRPAYVAKGAITLAKKLKASILPVLVWRQSKQLVIRVYEELSRVFAEEDEISVVKHYTYFLESHVKECPWLWLWLHNRWKV